jgi:chromosome segregation ATPase
MREERKIKGLKVQLKQKEGDVQALKIEIKAKQVEHNSMKSSIQSLKDQIQNFENKNNKPRVSEHAIIRYFERVKGYNLEEIEKEILSEEVLTLVDKLGGTGGYPNKDFQVFMKNYTVTTIVK